MHAIESSNPWRVQGLRQIEHMQLPRYDHLLRAIKHCRKTTCETLRSNTKRRTSASTWEFREELPRKTSPRYRLPPTFCA